MSEQVNGGAQKPELPQPTPVFDVTFQHFYGGQVFKQLWIFFYIGVAFLVGAILPWEGSAVGDHPWHAPGLMQAILAVFALACVIGGFVGLKGRRPAMTPLMFTEMIAIMFVVLFAFQASNVGESGEVAERLQEVRSEMGQLQSSDPRWKELEKEYNALQDGPSLVKDIVLGPFTTLTKPADDPQRQQFLRSWHTFGSGFYLTALTSVFTLLFMVVTIMGASKASKRQKEEMAEQRNAARRSSLKKDDKGGDAAKA